MNCSVCKAVKVESVVDSGEKGSWHSTCQRTPILGVQVLYKLYDLTKTEFESGFLCGVCFDLVVQIERLEAQLKCQVGQGCEKYRKHALNSFLDDKLWMEDSPSPTDLDDPHHPEEEEEEQQNEDDDFLNSDNDSEHANDKHDREEAKEELVPSPSPLKVYPVRKREIFKYTNTATALEGEKLKDLEVDTSQNEREPINLNLKPKIRGKARVPIPHNLTKYNIQKDNLDFNVTVGLTKTNTDALIYNGNKFYMMELYKDKFGKVPELMGHWKCRHINCRGRLMTYLNHQCVLLDTVVEHSHPPMPKNQLLIEEFHDQVKRLVIEHPDMTTSAVFTAAQAMCPNTPIVNKKLMLGYIRRQLKQRNTLTNK